MFPSKQELVNIIESLRSKLLAERRRNLVQEMEIRKEMGDAMFQQLMESEELRRSSFCTSGCRVCLPSALNVLKCLAGRWKS